MEKEQNEINKKYLFRTHFDFSVQKVKDLTFKLFNKKIRGKKNQKNKVEIMKTHFSVRPELCIFIHS